MYNGDSYGSPHSNNYNRNIPGNEIKESTTTHSPYNEPLTIRNPDESRFQYSPGGRFPTSPIDGRYPNYSPYDGRISSTSSPMLSPGGQKGRSLSSSSTASVGSQSGIQAQLSPPNMLPRVSEYQLKSLEANFKDNRNPSDLDITIISAEVGLPETEVKRWFEHRLARWRQQQGLPANSTSVTD